MEPENSRRSVRRISAGAVQLFVGPASSSRSLQMNVRSSTRATSDGSERARKLPGRLTGSSRCSVPAATIASHSSRYSASLPSHHTTRAGRVSATISRTQATRRGCRTCAGASIDAWISEEEVLFIDMNTGKRTENSSTR